MHSFVCASVAGLMVLACAGPLHGQEQPPLDAPTLIRNADASYLHGDYEAARQSLAAAWDLLQQTPPENPARYDVLKRLTSVRAAAGEFADAGKYLQLAIDWRKSMSGPDDPRIADDLLVSVSLLRGAKQFDQAFQVFPSILVPHVRVHGYDSAPVADDYSLMAQVLMDQKKPVDAAAILDVALGIRTRLSGSLDVALLPILDRLGGIQTALHDDEKAEATYRHALAIRETLYGKQDTDLLATLDGLASACFHQNKFDVAEPIYQRLLALWIASAGADHPMIAITLDKMAIFYAAAKKFDRAMESSDRANVIRTYFLANGLAAEAAEQVDEDHTEDARALYHRVMKLLDPPDAMYETLRAQTGIILQKMGDPPPRPQPKKAPPAGKKTAAGI
jgi:tetratricopeptide (TPR) repeat protein